MRPLAVAGAAATAAAMVGVALWISAPPRERMGELLAAVAAADVPPDDVHTQIPFVDATEWVELYRPEAAWNGYNLVLYRRRVPMIVDMNGRIVHTWPQVRASGRIRLDHRGRLAVIGTDEVVKEYDWEGNLIWAHRMPGADHLPHHDLLQLVNGNHLIMGRVKTGRVDYLHEVDREGRVVWEWTADEKLIAVFPEADVDPEDRTHLNSVQELPANPWFDDNDARFRPGNILVSARNLDGLVILDRHSGEVVWSYGRGLDYQHEAAMIPRGQLGEGLILVFDNGYRNRRTYRRSRIVAIDPIQEAEVWSYQAPGFFSSVAGAQQALPNGNVLITSSQGGRVFEITPGGTVVWQWIPPFEPMRAARIAYDHCPQLATLARPDEQAVTRSDRPRWIDLDLQQFTLPEEHVVREIHGRRRKLVPFNDGCRDLMLPSEPVLRVGYGFDPEAPGRGSVRAGFVVTVAGRGGGDVSTVLEDWLESGQGAQWRDAVIPLGEFDDEWVALCIRTGLEGPDGALPKVVWETPTVHSAARAQLYREWREMRQSLEERTLEERQLEAIGYVQ